ncbi:Ribosomal protein S18 [Gracilaria domingensis]|nr:Ribosomal protein S18 [Gracilaria domingensis]
MARQVFSAKPVPSIFVRSRRALASGTDASGTNGTESDSKKQTDDGFFEEENIAIARNEHVTSVSRYEEMNRTQNGTLLTLKICSHHHRDLSPLEVARMRVTYGLVKEHINAIEKGLPGLDPDSNPLIDPRSFNMRSLPQLPPEVLKQFRKEFPPDVAAESRSVSTYNLWESIQSGETHELLEEHKETTNKDEWTAVDERTMPPDQFTRLQRQSVTSKTHIATKTPAAVSQPAYFAPRKRKKGDCPLKDERGKASVDYRAVGTLKAFLSDNLKILPRQKSGLCAKSQRKLARAVKTARTMALLNPEPIPRLTVEEMEEMERHLP